MTIFNHNENPYPPILTICNFDHGLTSFAFFFLLINISPPSTTAQLVDAPPTPGPPGPFSGFAFDKPMAIITAVLVVTFFIVGFISVYTRHCAEQRIRGSLNLAIHLGASDRRSYGLDPEVIETFPTFVYSAVKVLKIGRGTLECAVCLNEFGDDETLRLIPQCNHVFHSHCIDVWLSSHSTCPVCRANLVPRPDDMIIAPIQIPDPGVDQSNENDPITEHEEDQNMDAAREHQNRATDSTKMNLLDGSQSTDQNRFTRSRSNGFSLPTLFRRSHSMGNSLVQSGKDIERYTLRLPEEVRSQLLNSTLKRTKSCVTFTKMSSGRMDYRTRSVGSLGGSNYLQNERFGGEGRPERGWFTLTPPFFSRGGSSRSGKGSGSGVATDNIEGERSTDRLFGGAEV